MQDFPSISQDELTRAHSRLKQPQWQPTAALLRTEAQSLSEKFSALPQYDSTWYDQNPTRDFAETYNEFAAYAYPAWRMLEAAHKLLLIDALFNEKTHTEKALIWTNHFTHNFKFHVQHHDAGLNYAHAAVALASIYQHAKNSLADSDQKIALEQLHACGQALRTSTAHWLKNLSHMPYNNHYAHHRLGLLSVALILQNSEWIHEALAGPKNFGELLVGSTTDNGLCYESSTVYHFVTLSGLLQTANLVRHHPHLRRDLFHETFANNRSLKHMFDAPLTLLLPNGELPSVGDCYNYRIPLWQLKADIYEQAYAVYQDPTYAWLLEKSGPRTTLSALLYGPDSLGPTAPPPVRTRIFIEHGYALLTSHTAADYFTEKSTAAFLTADRSGVHHHQDALSIQLALAGKPFLEDPETTAVELQAFAASIQKNFNRTMLPHNLIVVDQQDQADIPEPLPIIEFKDHPSFPTIAMADLTGALTPNITRLRHLALTPDYILDLYQIKSETEHTYDYLLHPRTDAPLTFSATEFTPKELPATPPYSILRNPLSSPIPSTGVTLQWSQSTTTFRCDLTANAPAEIISAEFPTKSDHTGPWKPLLMFRTRAPAADFLALYQLASASPNSPLWKITTATRTHNGLHHEFHIHTTNGTQSRHHLLKSL